MRVFLAVVLVLSACVDARVSPDELPYEIRPLPGATQVDARAYAGDAMALFTLRSSYPAHEVIAAIEERLDSEHWTARDFDHLNPSIPLSHRNGWSAAYHGTDGAWVHRWSGEWENSAGDIVSYDLEYFSPGEFQNKPEQPATTELKVYANYLSAETANRQKQEAAERERTGT